MQTNLFISEPFDFMTDDDTVWHDFCTECAGDVSGGAAICPVCDPL